MGEKYRIDQIPGPRLDDDFNSNELFLTVQKPNGLTYKMRASSLIFGSSNTVEWLSSPFIASQSSGALDIHVGGIFKKSEVSMVLVAYFTAQGANPSARFKFYTNSQRGEEYEHSLEVSSSDKAQWSSHFIWVPVIEEYIHLSIEDKNGGDASRRIDILAGS